MKLTAAQRDRACGVLLATAAGDALGAGYEFGPALPPGTPVSMIGGGGFNWEPGEWTDDTSMAIAIAQVAARGADLRDPAAQDDIVARWVDWSRTAKDVGTHTRRILGQLGDLPKPGIAAAVAGRLPCAPRQRSRHRRQRHPDAHRARRAGLPRRPRRARRPGPRRHRPGHDHPLRPRRRRGLRAVVPRDPPRRPHRRPRHPPRPGPPARRPGRGLVRQARRSRTVTSVRLPATTAGSSRRCRPRGPRSTPPRCPPTTPRSACSAPTISASPWRTPSEAATTPTPSPPSPAASWAPSGAHRPCRRCGARRFTAGPTSDFPRTHRSRQRDRRR